MENTTTFWVVFVVILVAYLILRISHARHERRIWEANQKAQQEAVEAGAIIDEDAVEALMNFGFTKQAAIAALRASAWAGNTTEERIVIALQNKPDYVGTKTRPTG